MNNPDTQAPTLHAQLQGIDLTDLSKRSGIPRRTLERIRAEADYHPAITTQLALGSALKRLKLKHKAARPSRAA